MLNHTVRGNMHFGDGSLVLIQGHGDVLFTRKAGERIRLVRVLFVPYLKNNIISLGQLDENGCKVVIEKGVLHVWDRRCRGHVPWVP
jgi:hypothetical protein